MKKFVIIAIGLSLNSCVTLNVYEKKVDNKQIMKQENTAKSGSITLNKSDFDSFISRNNGLLKQ